MVFPLKSVHNCTLHIGGTIYDFTDYLNFESWPHFIS